YLCKFEVVLWRTFDAGTPRHEFFNNRSAFFWVFRHPRADKYGARPRQTAPLGAGRSREILIVDLAGEDQGEGLRGGDQEHRARHPQGVQAVGQEGELAQRDHGEVELQPALALAVQDQGEQGAGGEVDAQHHQQDAVEPRDAVERVRVPEQEGGQGDAADDDDAQEQVRTGRFPAGHGRQLCRTRRGFFIRAAGLARGVPGRAWPRGAAGSVDAELLELVAQGAEGDAQRGGGLGLVVAVLLQGLLDGGAFDLLDVGGQGAA